MKSRRSFSRRDVLKLAALAPLALLEGRAGRTGPRHAAPGAPNVIILLFDAWSARHVQFHGYPRRTMPNLERFAARATVYHSHYSAGTFTVPGTASLLTGVQPWSHRALSLGGAGAADEWADAQIFAHFSDTHFTQAYSQNKFADALLFQCARHLDHHIPAGAFNLEQRFVYNLPVFANDAQVALGGLDANLFRDGGGESSGLFLNPVFRLLRLAERRDRGAEYKDEYPRGLPDDSEQFLLADVVDGAIQSLRALEEPALAYYHFYPPHENYCATRQFYKTFSSGWQPPDKPRHPHSSGRPYEELRQARQNYDEYLASWDAEAGRLFDFLQESGLLERSYVVITADHGELFERGERGHFTRMLFDALIHIPLIVSQPGQTERRDVYAATSSVDVLPTLAHLLGKPLPTWAEGQLLPGLGGAEDPGRGIYSMDAKENAAFAPLTKLTLSLIKDRCRLTLYRYPEGEQLEFFDLEADPDEMRDLYPARPAEARAMEDELLEKLADVNRPFERV